ncbi:serine/threonine-protein kinase [uncultured Microbulbifer sp.]|uniref:serine/threonine-protein kinase n=1 Tax=uncultured Microbulbifer sp. TaxID=348147 RepID=UPI002639E82F|nr:serine/threonine-protein kinase [uncultured Microbulbifer sp.]
MDVVALEKTEVYQGRYRVERTLGAGGMGVVYLAEDVKLGRKVAIKQLRSDMTGNSAEARFRSEAQLLARLNHPNIVRLYDVLEKEHNIALVMELVEGVTLKEWMRERTTTLSEKLDLLMQICQGLSKAHGLGIIHRDLKPENILVTNDGVAKITDFGIAKDLDCDQQLTREDHIAGSVQAMSPEQLQGNTLDPRSDLFSLGSIAYELLCDSKPFERGDKSPLAFAQQITSKPHIPPQQAWPEIPKPLTALLDRLLSKRPELRPESASAVFEALELVRKHGIDASTQQYSETVTQLLIKPRKKRRQIISVFMGLALIGIFTFWGWRTFLQLPPQYIAVLPVEINGAVRGEENAEMLVKAMVRQALLGAPTQLKSSALVSYSALKNASHEEQLKNLQNKGVTDALLARLDCMQLRCNIELQRINPSDNQIQYQTSFVFLSDKRQEAQYTIGNSVVELFSKNYRKKPNQEVRMDNGDYNRYLTVLYKIDGDEAVSSSDLEVLKELIGTYPQNTNLYSAYAKASAALFTVTNDNRLLSGALGVLVSAEGFASNQTAILEAKLLIKSLGTDRKGFESILKKLQTQGHPSAHLLIQFSRFQYLHGRHEESLIYAQEAAALNPSFNNFYYIAINEIALGNYDSARITLNKMIKTYPERWKAYNLLGVIELETGNLNEAERAITSIPEKLRDWPTKSNLGTIYFLKGNYKEALNSHKSLYKDSPNNLTAIYHLAETYLVLQNKAKASEYFSKIIDLTTESQDILARRYRAEALAYTGKTSASISLIKELLRDAPDSTNIMRSAALVYTLAEEWQSASYHLEQLIEQGLSPEWFSLPVFKRLCTQPQTAEAVVETICS